MKQFLVYLNGDSVFRPTESFKQATFYYDVIRTSTTRQKGDIVTLMMQNEIAGIDYDVVISKEII